MPMYSYPQPCRRPADGRHGENPNRLQHHYQFQVLLAYFLQIPKILSWLTLPLLALIQKTTTFAVETSTGEPNACAWGLGWEVWRLTAWRSLSSRTWAGRWHEGDPVPAEISAVLSVLSAYAQGVDSVYDWYGVTLPGRHANDGLGQGIFGERA